MKRSENMNEMNVTETLLKAILKLIEKCQTLEELWESVKRIMNEQVKREQPPFQKRRSPT